MVISYSLLVIRGSLYETQHWLRRAYRRKLIKHEHVESIRQLVDKLGPAPNAYITSINRQANKKPAKKPRTNS